MLPFRSRWRPRRQCCGVLPVLCTAMLLIAIALATWALVEGVRGTHHQVDKFWAIEQSVRDQVCRHVMTGRFLHGFFSPLLDPTYS